MIITSFLLKNSIAQSYSEAFLAETCQTLHLEATAWRYVVFHCLQCLAELQITYMIRIDMTNYNLKCIQFNIYSLDRSDLTLSGALLTE